MRTIVLTGVSVQDWAAIDALAMEAQTRLSDAGLQLTKSNIFAARLINHRTCKPSESRVRVGEEHLEAETPTFQQTGCVSPDFTLPISWSRQCRLLCSAAHDGGQPRKMDSRKQSHSACRPHPEPQEERTVQIHESVHVVSQ